MRAPSPARRLLVLIAGSVLVLAACSTAGPPSPSTTSVAPGSEESADPSALPSGVVLPAPEISEVRLGNSGEATANNLNAVVAQHLNLGAEYGLDIEWIPFDGAAPAAQALLAEQVHVADNSGGPAIASLATDSPMLMVYVSRDNVTDNLYAQPDVQSADDLRGGSVAISSFGSQSHAGALLALDALGLTADDVTITQVGNDSARLAALQAGSVTASMNDATQADELEGLGLNILVRLSEQVDDADSGVARISLTALRPFTEENPNTILNLVAMYLEASVIWRNDPELAAEALAELAEMPLEEAQAEVDFILTEPWRPLDGRCNPGVMEFTRQTLVETNPDIADVDPTEACTNDFIDQLTDLGFLAEIGVEGY